MPFGGFERGDAAFFEHGSAVFVRDDGGAGEEAVAPGVVGVVVGVDHIADGDVQFVFDEFADAQGFVGQGEGVDHYRPLRTGDDARRHLRIHFALEPIYIFGYTFSVHSKSLGKIFPIDSINGGKIQVV